MLSRRIAALIWLGTLPGYSAEAYDTANLLLQAGHDSRMIKTERFGPSGG